MVRPSPPDVDILVVGAGVLGVTVAYWLSSLYDCTVALSETSESAAMHMSSRNTGVIHRPFYLDPRKKRVFARTSRVSLPLWERLARSAGLPWKPVGTFNVALDEPEVRTLERYRSWGVENGMEEQELELLDQRGVSSLEPQVMCRVGLLSKTDVSVDFGAFTRHILRHAISAGVRFLGGHRAAYVRRGGDAWEVGFSTSSGRSSMRCKLLVNTAGGAALEIAHACGLATDYTALNFRGEYWAVEEPFASKVTSNIYRPPHFPQFPFLDPHFVVRADGSRQIGPNAVLVLGPYVYSGVGLTKVLSLLDRPVGPKVNLMSNRDFLTLLAGEWRSSLSKSVMCARVQKFVPSLDTHMLRKRAVFGVRTSVIGAAGFVPEVLLVKGEGSAHVINFNSPGATGAPAYSALMVEELRSAGMLDGFRTREPRQYVHGWDFESVVAAP
jgi:(S)-2-hydroxyglutarate dehydrogenase